MWRWILIAVFALVIGAGVYVLGIMNAWYGVLEGPGSSADATRPAESVAERAKEQQRAASRLSSSESPQILFGDLHVHTTYSTDAFLWSLPMMNGEGGAPLADACDYARFCSQLDFWSINDHAEASTPRKWQNTVDAIRQCNAVAGDTPDTVAFLGWEWTQVGRTPKDHWGHKNVILRNLEDGAIPTRPIGAGGLATDGLRGRIEGAQLPWPVPLLDFENRQPYYDFGAFLKEVREVPFCPQDVPANELPSDCYEYANEPVDLFRKLDEWDLDSMVIPHGNTWGFYSPAGTSWDKQLTAAHDDPSQQFLIEVMSGHGNSEEYRDWRAIVFDENGNAMCPEPTPDYLPSCWRAGEIIEARCLEEGTDGPACAARAVETRAPVSGGGPERRPRGDGRDHGRMARQRTVPRLLPPLVQLPPARLDPVRPRPRRLCRGRGGAAALPLRDPGLERQPPRPARNRLQARGPQAHDRGQRRARRELAEPPARSPRGRLVHARRRRPQRHDPRASPPGRPSARRPSS